MNRLSFLQTKTVAVGGAKKKVLVLGAGLAGLTAAWELHRAGHEVTVIEAQTRPGGRILTLREGFSPGLSAEAGAMSFSDSYRHLFHYLHLFQIPYASLATAAVRSASQAVLYHLRGKRFHAKADGTIAWPYDLTSEERTLERKRDGILRKYILSVLDDVSDPTDSYSALPEWVRPYDQKTLLDLAAESGASQGARDLIRYTYWFADARDQESAAASLLADLSLFYRGQEAYGFPKGSDVLPLAFASRLRDQILYGAEVVRIEQLPEQAGVVVKKGGLQHQLTADQVVCTIPFSVLRYIEIDPPFSSAKSDVISGLEYRTVTRVFLQVRRRFWENEGVTGGAMTDLSIGQVQKHPIFHTGGEGARAILEAHVRGDAAPELDRLAEDDRLQYVLAEIEKVHPGVSSHYEGGRTKSWQDDPWSRGAYSSFRKGQMTTWLPNLVLPEGRIHFAGEHTSIFPGTIEGAIESGVRAAREVEEA